MQKYYKKKPSIKKGTILSIEVSDIIKNHYVDEKDFYIHTFEIKDDYDNITKFDMRQMAQDPKLSVGTYVSFRFNKHSDFTNKLIEAKSFCKAFTQEEISELNKKNNPTNVEEVIKTDNVVKKQRSSYKR